MSNQSNLFAMTNKNQRGLAGAGLHKHLNIKLSDEGLKILKPLTVVNILNLDNPAELFSLGGHH